MSRANAFISGPMARFRPTYEKSAGNLFIIGDPLGKSCSLENYKWEK